MILKMSVETVFISWVIFRLIYGSWFPRLKFLEKPPKKNKEQSPPLNSTSDTQQQTTQQSHSRQAKRETNYFFTCNGCGGEFDKDLELNKSTCQACYIKDR